MNSILVKSVKFERPRGTSVREAREHLKDNVQWEFLAELDSDLPHGLPSFGGLLGRIKTVDGEGWTAKHYDNTPWGAVSATRQGAIQNIVPKVIEVLTAWETEKAAQEQAAQQRRAVAVTLQQHLFNANRTGMDIKLRIHDGEPLRFTVELSNLSEAQVRELAKDLESA